MSASVQARRAMSCRSEILGIGIHTVLNSG